MHGLRLVTLVIAAALVAAIAPAATSAATGPVQAVAAAKKRCNPGYKRVKVRRAGKTRTVCRRRRASANRQAGAGGPSPAQVEAAIAGVLRERRDSYLPESAVEVRFDRPTQVLPQRTWDFDPSTSLGEMPVYPVRAWVTVITHRDDTPEDDTRYQGCNGHLDSTWPYDSVFLFYESSAGGWEWRTDTARGVGC